MSTSPPNRKFHGTRIRFWLYSLLPHIPLIWHIQNILNRRPYPAPEFLTNPYDAASIMQYPYPAQWTLDGPPQAWNQELSDGDHYTVATIYPLGGHVISSQRTQQPDDHPIHGDYCRFDFPMQCISPRVVSCLDYVQSSNASSNFCVTSGVCTMETDRLCVVAPGMNDNTFTKHGCQRCASPLQTPCSAQVR